MFISAGRLRILGITALVLVLTILTIGGIAYFFIDARIGTRLSRAEQPQLSAVYTDLLAITPELRLSETQLKEQLRKRRYIQVDGEPKSPGEFQWENGRLRVMTREFSGPDGVAHPSQEVVLDLEHPITVKPLLLEPQVVSVLGSGEVRAAEQHSLRDFPAYLMQAIIAIEDERFYSHHGIDIQGILRALLANIRAMEVVQGGSTITQQLAKNLFLTPKRSLVRKLLEVVAALSLEHRLSKDRILEMYLNEVYLGQEGAVAVHGFAEAAKTFFGRQIEDLSLPQAALLAGIIKAPSYYSPRRHAKRALKRRNLVLARMRELGFISSDELNQAQPAKLEVIQETLHQRKAPHFFMALQQNLSSSLNLEAAAVQGLHVYSGLDLDMQECAENAVIERLANAEKTFPALTKGSPQIEAGLVSIEPFSGKIRAWVGGRDYGQNQFDHVSQGKRQIGSTIKPFLYLTALDGNLNKYKVATALSILSDRPLQVNLVTRRAWEPENYDREYHGDVTLRYALENSLNVPAVYTAQKFGIQALASTVRRLHVSTDIPVVPALALGATDTTLLDLTAAYAALANGGVYIAPRLFVSARDNDGQPLATSPVEEEPVADEDAVYVLTNILQGVIDRGTGKAVRRLGYTGPAAGKTGTSSDARDAWFVGFTPDLATGVWVGYDDNRKIGLTGGVLAAPIWTAYMKCVAQFHAISDFVPPPGVVFVDIDSQSGELASEACPPESITREVFVRGTEPAVLCRLHAGTARELATENEPEQEVVPVKRRRRGFWDKLFDW